MHGGVRRPEMEMKYSDQTPSDQCRQTADCSPREKSLVTEHILYYIGSYLSAYSLHNSLSVQLSRVFSAAGVSSCATEDVIVERD